MPTDPRALGRRLLALPAADLERALRRATEEELAAYEQASAAVEAEARALAWRASPASWLDECVDFSGVPGAGELAPYQSGSLTTLAETGRLAIRSPHGVGKTAIASLGLLWFATSRDALGLDWKIPTTASVYRQLLHYLWPEVHLWADRLRWDVLGRPPFSRLELQATRLKLAHGQAWAMASNDPAAIEGAHARELLYIFDEAKAIPDGVWDAAEGAFAGAGADTGAKAYALAISTPGEPAGRFYDINARRPGLEHWSVRHVRLAEAVAAGRISREWAETMARMWPRGSATYSTRVLGEFASSPEDAVIPLAWVEAANERWYDRVARGAYGPVTHCGADIARAGDDVTVLAELADDFMGRPWRPGAGDTIYTAGAIARRVGIGGRGPITVVDADGLGAGVYDQLRTHPDLAPRLHAFHAGTASDWSDWTGQLKFANLRAAAWWHLQDALNPRLGATLALPPDHFLTGDLTSPKWRYSGRDRIVIESKDQIKARIGRSTDTGDALVMALWGRILGLMGWVGKAPGPAGGTITGDLLDMVF